MTTKIPLSSGAQGFAATRWTIVMAAARGGNTTDALAELCRTYWYPLYAYLRRSGQGTHEAEDSTQAFFAHVLSRNFFANIDREKGKFRSFLLASLKHFLADELDRAQAQKRGGRISVVSLDGNTAECRYSLEPAHQLSPDRLFEKHWALSLLDQVLSRLRSELAGEGREALFDAVEGTLTGHRELSYNEVALELGLTEAAVKSAAHRIRRRFRELLIEEINRTVASPDDVQDEIRYLMSCL